MKASSESGECASLISIQHSSARGADWVAGMAWLRPFHLAMNDPEAPSQSLEAARRHCGADRVPERERTSGVSRNLRVLAPERFAGKSVTYWLCDNKYLEEPRHRGYWKLAGGPVPKGWQLASAGHGVPAPGISVGRRRRGGNKGIQRQHYSNSSGRVG